MTHDHPGVDEEVEIESVLVDDCESKNVNDSLSEETWHRLYKECETWTERQDEPVKGQEQDPGQRELPRRSQRESERGHNGDGVIEQRQGGRLCHAAFEGQDRPIQGRLCAPRRTVLPPCQRAVVLTEP